MVTVKRTAVYCFIFFLIGVPPTVFNNFHFNSPPPKQQLRQNRSNFDKIGKIILCWNKINYHGKPVSPGYHRPHLLSDLEGLPAHLTSQLHALFPEHIIVAMKFIDIDRHVFCLLHGTQGQTADECFLFASFKLFQKLRQLLRMHLIIRFFPNMSSVSSVKKSNSILLFFHFPINRLGTNRRTTGTNRYCTRVGIF